MRKKSLSQETKARLKKSANQAYYQNSLAKTQVASSKTTAQASAASDQVSGSNDFIVSTFVIAKLNNSNI